MSSYVPCGVMSWWTECCLTWGPDHCYLEYPVLYIGADQASYTNYLYSSSMDNILNSHLFLKFFDIMVSV